MKDGNILKYLSKDLKDVAWKVIYAFAGKQHKSKLKHAKQSIKSARKLLKELNGNPKKSAGVSK